jgi:hypothetical protein
MYKIRAYTSRWICMYIYIYTYVYLFYIYVYIGGMGIHFFKNAAFGGDWILQERMVGTCSYM